MSVGSFRGVRTWVVVFLAAGATCAVSCATREAGKEPVFPNEHVVLLRPGHVQGQRVLVAVPNHLVVSGYETNPPSVVIWSYPPGTTARIKFNSSKPPIPDPACDDAAGECRLSLPRGLAKHIPYKYTTTGSDAQGPYAPNDPDIEVDR